MVASGGDRDGRDGGHEVVAGGRGGGRGLVADGRGGRGRGTDGRRDAVVVPEDARQSDNSGVIRTRSGRIVKPVILLRGRKCGVSCWAGIALCAGAQCAGHVTCAVPAAVDGRRRAAAVGESVAGRGRGRSGARAGQTYHFVSCLYFMCQYTSQGERDRALNAPWIYQCTRLINHINNQHIPIYTRLEFPILFLVPENV